MAEDHLDRYNPAFIVKTVREGGIWTAECDALGLVTEADSFEGLTERVWQIAPELAELNGYNIPPEALRLRFEYTEYRPHHHMG